MSTPKQPAKAKKHAFSWKFTDVIPHDHVAEDRGMCADCFIGSRDQHLCDVCAKPFSDSIHKGTTKKSTHNSCAKPSYLCDHANETPCMVCVCAKDCACRDQDGICYSNRPKPRAQKAGRRKPWCCIHGDGPHGAHLSKPDPTEQQAQRVYEALFHDLDGTGPLVRVLPFSWNGEAVRRAIREALKG